MIEFLFNQLLAGSLLLYLILSFTLMLAYFVVRTEKTLLFNSLALLLMFFFAGTLFIPETAFSPGDRISSQNALAPIFYILLTLTVQSMCKVYLSDTNRIVFPILILMSVVTFFCTFSVFTIHAARLITVGSLFFYTAHFVFIMREIKKIKPEIGATTFTVTLMSMVLFIVLIDMIASIFGWFISNYVLIFASLIFIPFFAVVFAKEFMKNQFELMQVYAELSKMQNTVKGPSITETSEEKLKRIIEFIHDNFSSDISREGLAEAVDMNANYMGSLFKSYTGKKIKDYINELRIQEAANILASTDYKIIDIAFSVGFESLVTFNRKFKTIIGKTPTQFRSNPE